ncbi:MAG: polyribonucleotide nucleotidyltransferase [Candidatus Omnitrophica bacterium]|nr:polyribonucleotide nucleotidyltransferase [Candidatus Omnitrophota bacterium]
MAHRVETSLGASTLSLETGKVARQADGAVIVQQGETVLLATVVFSRTPSDKAMDIVPLTVDYREKSSAAGRIPGGFFKREGRPTEKEILSARLIDRPIRPLFPKGFQHEVLIMVMVLSSDGQYDPDVLAVFGAATALRLSPIAFPHALAAVRVGLVNGQWVANPTYQQLANSSVDLVVEGTREGILSIEAGMKEVPEQQVNEAVVFGYEQVLKLLDAQDQLVKAAGKPKEPNVTIRQASAELIAAVRKRAGAALENMQGTARKEDYQSAYDALLASLKQELAPEGSGVDPAMVLLALHDVEREHVRHAILSTKKRMDGRPYTQFRDITCEVGVLPRTHGSSLFTRGETQSLTVTTLGTSDDEQHVEALEGESYKRFMLHYNFPPFSVGEVRRVGSPGRREIGHGALAERALAPMVPSKDEFPYTIRLVSDILESNGSSSMATVCAGTLALMDAGVPIKAMVSGVAMGLIKEAEGTAILTDISGLEDHLGDMDFKVAGTRLGVTALQVDVKLSQGLTTKLVADILAQAHPARLLVLDLMAKTLDKPRLSTSPYAPRITTIKVNPERIRDVIGPGGRVIRKIVEETGAKIDIEDDGTIAIASADSKASERAIEIIRSLTEDAEVGKLYNAKVKRVTSFGAFCEYLPGKEGLVHISELADKRVEKVDDVVKVGDEFRVKVIEIDEQGRINLSRKRALEG